MKNLSFKNREDALEAAQELANEIGGYVAKNTVTVGTTAFETPDELDSWSGYTSAYEVREANHSHYAYVAFWE